MMQHSATPHTGGVTISARITRQLIEELKTGRFSLAAQLPSEVELAQEFQVSRSVVRDVLANLEREGFVARYRGIGTVIQRDVVNLKNRMDLKIEYNDIIRSLGGEPTSDHVKVQETKADEYFSKVLKVPVGEPLLVREKRVLADGVPVLYSEDTLPKSLFQNREYAWVDWGEPIFDIFEREYQVVIDIDMANFKAVHPNEKMQKELQVSPTAPLIQMEEVGYHKMTHPVLHTIGHYTDYFSFTILRKKF